MTTWGMLGDGVGDGVGDAERGGVSGDCGSGMAEACSKMAAPGTSSRSDPGAVLADNSGGDDAGGPSCAWLVLLLLLKLPALTNRSTSDGRAFNRGRNPTCIQDSFV
jgi:hypothetical protein